jgi:methionyl-tRNA synthetase
MPARWASIRALQTGALRSQRFKPYYVTTPIFYPNAVPHIGHLQSMILADVLARWAQWRHRGWSPHFDQPTDQDGVAVMATGTDEHGSKIQKAALAFGDTPRTLCDRVSSRFRDLADAADIRYTRFIRTTDADHIDTVKTLWVDLMRKGYIYKGKHSGWYSVVDEAFYTQKEVEASAGDPDQMISKVSGNAVEWTDEENYKFRLSQFKDAVRQWLASNKGVIVPDNRYAETLAELEDVEDLSISRPYSRLQWGIRVPDDDTQTMYVWFDALMNYLTVTGYPWTNVKSRAWPADVLVVGKDIIRFHAIYFPAFLLALDIPLPRQIVAHGHWTVDNFKMSKSRGNVVDPFKALEVFGKDDVRFFMTRIGGNLSKDVSWTNESLFRFRHKYLQGLFGNLLARIVSPKTLNKLFESDQHSVTISAPSSPDHDTDVHLQALSKLANAVDESMTQFDLSVALTQILDILSDSQRHWTHALFIPPSQKEGKPAQTKDSISQAIYVSMETLRIAALLTQSVMPEKAKMILDILEVDPSERTFASSQQLRPSITLKRRTANAPQVFPQLSLAVQDALLDPEKSAQVLQPSNL